MSKRNAQRWFVIIALILLALLSWQLTNGGPDNGLIFEPQAIEHIEPVALVASQESGSNNTRQLPQSLAKQCDMDAFFNQQQVLAEQRLNRLRGDFVRSERVLNGWLNVKMYHVGIREKTLNHFFEQLHSVSAIYALLIESNTIKQTYFNLVVLPNRASYENYSSRYGFDPRNSRGVYFHGSNSAFVEHQNDEQLVTTAVHEAVHAMNLRLLGVTPRWLNEGLAQVLSRAKYLSDEIPLVELDKIKHVAQAYDIYALLDSESQWGSVDTGDLYFSGKTWVHFLLSNLSGTHALRQVLKHEQSAPCTLLSSDEVYELIQNAYSAFEQDFYDWY